MNGCKLSPTSLGLSLGILWGLWVMIMGIMVYNYSFGRPFVEAMATVYQGYEPSVKGAMIGGLIGFIHIFVMGFLIGWLYNCFLSGSCCCVTTTKSATVVDVVPVEKKPRAAKAPAKPKTKVTKE